MLEEQKTEVTESCDDIFDPKSKRNGPISFVSQVAGNIESVSRSVIVEKIRAKMKSDDLNRISYAHGIIGKFSLFADEKFQEEVNNSLDFLDTLGEVVPENINECFVFGDKFVIQFSIETNNEIFSYRAFILSDSRSTINHVKDQLSKLETDIDYSIVDIKTYFHDWKGEIGNIIVNEEISETVHQEAYPFIPNLDQFIEDYFTSNDSTLIFIGPPGTGKTKLIRHIIRYANKNIFLKDRVYYTSSSKVLESDEIFTEIMRFRSILVLEDIDFHLRDRSEHNPLMYKLLGSSDGLISTNGKIIISTNMDSISKMDQALSRPGRSYAVINFRKLNLDEANKLLDKLGTGSRLTEHGDYSLSQVYRFYKTGKLDVHGSVDHGMSKKGRPGFF